MIYYPGEIGNNGFAKFGRGGGGGGGGGVNEVFYEQCGSGEAGMVHRTVSCSKVG